MHKNRLTEFTLLLACLLVCFPAGAAAGADEPGAAAEEAVSFIPRLMTTLKVVDEAQIATLLASPTLLRALPVK